MLFTKKIDPSCAYCQRGKPITSEKVLCPKKGVVFADASSSAICSLSLHDAPPRPILPDFSKLRDEDFTL